MKFWTSKSVCASTSLLTIPLEMGSLITAWLMWPRLKFLGCKPWVKLEKVDVKLEHAGVKLERITVSVTTCLMIVTCWFASEALRKPKSWLLCLHQHASPSLALPVRPGYQDCCVREEIGSPTAAKWRFFRSDFARRCCTSSSACLLSSYEASAEEVVACFSTENQNSVQQCRWLPVSFTHKTNVPCVLHVTILAYTNSRLETGVQSA